MEYINNKIVDITFIENTMIIYYDNNETESLILGKDTYKKMYKEWLVEQPPFISDIYKKNMNNIILSSIHNNQDCVNSLNNFFVYNNKEDVIKFINYMRSRDLTQEKLKWNKPFDDLYNKQSAASVPAPAPTSTPTLTSKE
jgi:dihydrofolate reductase